MKTIKWIWWGVIMVYLIGSGFSFASPGMRPHQSGTVVFCETYTKQEVVSMLKPEDPFFKLIQMEQGDPGSSRLGSCSKTELNEFLDYVRSDSFRNRVPQDLFIATGVEEREQRVFLYAIKQTDVNQAFPSKRDIREVGVDYDEANDSYMLTITFSESAAGKWAALTKKNIGKDIAMLYNDRVLSAPRVRDEIKGGICSISGNFTEQEIHDLKQVLEN